MSRDEQFSMGSDWIQNKSSRCFLLIQMLCECPELVHLSYTVLQGPLRQYFVILTSDLRSNHSMVPLSWETGKNISLNLVMLYMLIFIGTIIRIIHIDACCLC